MADGRFLKSGDVVAVTIEHIGTLTSTLADAIQGAVVKT
jgi:2-keto-4-pentenoate hydratase/2-oxohepta-3-ene-1,7-dioic acid hydratase in catechol pathway